jgi:hypothetical protein
LAQSNVFDAGSSAAGNSAAADSGPLSIHQTNELLFAAGMTGNEFTGAGIGFIERTITAPDSDIVEDELAGVVGAYDGTASLISGSWLMQAASFKPALPPAPILQISLTTSNTLVAQWPLASVVFRLQSSAALAPGNWQNATNSVSVVNGEYQAAFSPSSSQQFYRLIYP